MGKEKVFLSKYLKNYMQAIPMNIFFKDAECRYIYASEICEHLNKQGDDWTIIGKTELEVQRFPELAKAYYEDDLRILKTGRGSTFISEFPMEDKTYYYEIKKDAVRDDKGGIIGIVGVVNDVTEKMELQKQVEQFYMTDPVTKLYNRKYLEAWKRVENPGFPLTLIACDCNYLKKVNDTYGHESGDELLAMIGELFHSCLPKECIAVREGGDEFLLICNHTGEAQAQELIHMLMEKANEHMVGETTLSIAYGAYTMQEETYDFERGHREADQRMYQMKREMKE